MIAEDLGQAFVVLSFSSKMKLKKYAAIIFNGLIVSVFVYMTVSYNTGTIMRGLSQPPLVRQYFESFKGISVLRKKNITCRKMKYSEPHLPVTALISYPGSGNTWLRHLLQKATGVYTGSADYDQVLIKGGFPGEHKMDGSVIAVKTHTPCSRKDPFTFDRVILLIRDAREAGKSEFNRKHSDSNHTGFVNATALQKGLPRFLETQLPVWKGIYVDCLTSKYPVIMVDYEQLKLNIKQEMSTVFDFLNITVTDDDLECMATDNEGNFHRKSNTTLPELSQDYINKYEQSKKIIWSLYQERQQSEGKENGSGF